MTHEIAPPPYFHGTRARLRIGDLITPGYRSNFGSGRVANNVYLAASMDAAIWGAELAEGDGPGRIYVVEPTGPIEHDPNLTDKKFPGNPTKSYRFEAPAARGGRSGRVGRPRLRRAADHERDGGADARPRPGGHRRLRRRSWMAPSAANT